MASMTKEELKTALINHGAPVPATSAKKEEFLQAYEEHIGPMEEDAGEFSSDNELATPSKKKASNTSRRSTAGSASKLSTSSSASKLSSSSRKSNGSPKKKSPKKSTTEESLEDIEMTVDIGSLDDSQLFEMLKKNGVEVGPIVASTRKFYEKKLALSLTGLTPGVTPSKSDSNGYSDTEPEDDDEEDEQPAVQVVHRKKTPRSSTKAASSSLSESGLRQRLTLSDSLDSSPGVASPRRAIHSYKVTETTRQVTTRARDGTETTDTKHWVERTESTGGGAAVGSAKRSFLSGLLYPLLKLVIVLILLAGLYVAFTTPSDGVTPMDKVIETINSALPPSETPGDPVEEVVFEKPTVTEAPPPRKPVREPLPDAGNVVDV